MSNEEKIAAIQRFERENPDAGSPSVFRAVIWYLSHGDIAGAQEKIQFDSDKFLDREKTLAFFLTIGLISDSYRVTLDRWLWRKA